MSDSELHEIKAANTQKLHEIKAAKVIVLYLISNGVCFYALLLLIWLCGGCVGFSAKVFCRLLKRLLFVQLIDVGEGLEASHGGGIVLGADHEDAAFLGDDEVLETADGGEVP